MIRGSACCSPELSAHRGRRDAVEARCRGAQTGRQGRCGAAGGRQGQWGCLCGGTGAGGRGDPGGREHRLARDCRRAERPRDQDATRRAVALVGCAELARSLAQKDRLLRKAAALAAVCYRTCGRNWRRNEDNSWRHLYRPLDLEHPIPKLPPGGLRILPISGEPYLPFLRFSEEDRREIDRWLYNRAENSHLPFRHRERAMLRFQRMRSLQKFASVHASVTNHFNQNRSLSSRNILQARPDRRSRRVALSLRRLMVGPTALSETVSNLSDTTLGARPDVAAVRRLVRAGPTLRVHCAAPIHPRTALPPSSMSEGETACATFFIGAKRTRKRGARRLFRGHCDSCPKAFPRLPTG